MKVNKISPASGTAITLGDSGDTFTITSGVTLAGAGTSLTALNATQLTSGTIPIARIADDAVTTAKLAADAITAAKIADDVINSEHYAAASIDNEHLADDAVGVAELSATGTASNSTFLRGDNAWAAAGGGAWELLHAVTVSSATANVILSTGMSTSYRRYKIHFALKTPSSGVWLYLRGRKSGSIVTSNYSYATLGHHSGGTSGDEEAGADSGVALGHYAIHGPNQQVHGEIDFADIYSDGWYRGHYQLVGRKSSSGWETFFSTGGFGFENGGAWDGFQFYFNSGNIQPTSRFYLLGQKNS